MTRLIQQPRFYYLVFTVLLLPALFINLGVHHIFVHTDEGRRALVALEMMLSGQYWAPTLNGAFYFEKPPLFNWILALSFKAFGSYSLFALRFPVAIFVFLYGMAMHYFLKPIIGLGKTWLVIIATITSGRILFYDSFLGLIDIGFSILVFINFMLFFKLGRSRQYFKLFALTYLIAAVAYLMKGLPAVVFQFFTLIAWAIYIKDWKFVFNKFNFLGTLFFLVPVGLYYFFYQKVHPDSLLTVFEYTWHQSSQRTVTEYSFLDTIIGTLTFPFENMYHFAPWTLLVAALFTKGTIKKVWENEFSRYLILVFGCNILVYWTSPGVHPRYLFMFLPLFFGVLVEGFFLSSRKFQHGIEMVFFVVMALVALLPLGAWIYVNELGDVANPAPKAVFLLICFALLLYLYFRVETSRLVILGIFLLVIRIGFNWFILPFKDPEGQGFADAAEKVIELTEGEELYVLNPNYCHNGTSFLISRQRGEILELRNKAEPNVWYILYDDVFDPVIYHSYLEFGTRGTSHHLRLVKLK